MRKVIIGDLFRWKRYYQQDSFACLLICRHMWW